jgi:hypothetical protein
MGPAAPTPIGHGLRIRKGGHWRSSPVCRGDRKAAKNGGPVAFRRRQRCFGAWLQLKGGLQHLEEMKILSEGHTMVGGGRRVELTDEVDGSNALMDDGDQQGFLQHGEV